MNGFCFFVGSRIIYCFCLLIIGLSSLQYGYTVMHESILWCDVNSLTAMLSQETAHFFQKLFFIVSSFNS